MNMIGDLDANGEGGSHVGAKQDGARNLLAHLPSKIWEGGGGLQGRSKIPLVSRVNLKDFEI